MPCLPHREQLLLFLVGDTFFSLAEINIRPVKPVSLSVAVDLNWDAYRLNSNYYWKPGGAQNVTIADMSPDYTQIKKSVLRSFGFDVPVQLCLHLGDFKLAAGVVGEYNLPGRTKFKAIDASGAKVKNGALRVKDIEARPFTWSYRASLSYNSLGLYFKYSPVSQFAEGKGPQFSNYTVGLMIW